MSSASLTPPQLIQARFNWLKQADFSSIYRSYHDDSRFKEQFASLEEYLALVRDQGLAEIEVQEIKLIADQTRGSLARVLSYQSYIFQRVQQSTLEIATLRLDDGEWKVLSSKRIGCDENVDLGAVTWENVESNPEAITL